VSASSFSLSSTPPPPRSPLFPYTTLFRSRRLVAETRARLERAAQAIDDRRAWQELVGEWKSDHPDEGRLIEEYRAETMRAREFRSEEHTSELQSLTNLLCPLLLDKKNKHT